MRAKTHFSRSNLTEWVLGYGCSAALTNHTPKSLFFRRACPACPDVLCQGASCRLLRESGRGVHKPSDFLKALIKPITLAK